MAAGDEDVLPAIVIEIGDGGRVTGHGDAEAGHAAGGGNIGETALAEVAEQGEGFEVEGDENQVGEAVVIEIASVNAHAGDELTGIGEGDTGLEAGLFKLTAAFVVEEGILHLVVGDEDIGEAVEIEVCHGGAHALAGVGADAGIGGGIAEGAVAIIEE